MSGTTTPPGADVLESAAEASTLPLVLLADMNPDSRERRARQLQARGFRVAVARTCFETIVKASCQLPDLIVVGLQEDTADTVDLLSTCPATAHIPVVRLTHGRALPARVLSDLRHAQAR
jgi:CheY-like chemotaxis protein